MNGTCKIFFHRFHRSQLLFDSKACRNMYWIIDLRCYHIWWNTISYFNWNSKFRHIRWQSWTSCIMIFNIQIFSISILKLSSESSETRQHHLCDLLYGLDLDRKAPAKHHFSLNFGKWLSTTMLRWKLLVFTKKPVLCSVKLLKFPHIQSWNFWSIQCANL